MLRYSIFDAQGVLSVEKECDALSSEVQYFHHVSLLFSLATTEETTTAF